MSETSAKIQERQADTQPQAAHVIADDDALAIAAVHALAQWLAEGAAERDRERRLPRNEIEWVSQSGLWAITVPKAYGGAGVSYVTLTEVFKIVSAADPSLGQLPQNHFGLVDVIALTGTDAQKRHFFAEVLSGKRFGNGFSEKGTKHVLDLKTRVRRDGDDYVVDGTKFYSTGALFAHYVPVLGLDDERQAWLAYIPQPTPGLRVIDDWSGFGQRTTASGTVVLDNVRVSASHVLPAQRMSDLPTLNGPLSQILQAAIDAGIAKAALDDTLAFVRTRTRTRPWVDSGVERAADDPLTIREIGHLHIQLHAAEALLERAARMLDAIAARGDGTEDDVARASVAVGEAKVLPLVRELESRQQPVAA
ncbi:SfnB family sulfur acquisition oxidoreductase [Burkholderia catarinensis]|nr:SfnB family sulfur acquisition oxidoreductase [Burkholderia catarinensis]